MQITDIKVFPVDPDPADGKLRAFVTLTFDDCFVVRDVKVISGPDGLFVAMPAKRRKDGTFKDLAHPANAETRAWLEREVLEAYARHPAPPPTGRSPQKQVAPSAQVK